VVPDPPEMKMRNSLKISNFNFMYVQNWNVTYYYWDKLSVNENHWYKRQNKPEVGRENNTKTNISLQHTFRENVTYIYQPIEKWFSEIIDVLLAQNALSKSNCVVSLSKFGISMNFVRVQYLNIWMSDLNIWIFERWTI